MSEENKQKRRMYKGGERKFQSAKGGVGVKRLYIRE